MAVAVMSFPSALALGYRGNGKDVAWDFKVLYASPELDFTRLLASDTV